MSFWSRLTGGSSHQAPEIGDYDEDVSPSISSQEDFADGAYYDDDDDAYYEEEYDDGAFPLPEGPPPTENVFQNVASPPMHQRKKLPSSLDQFGTSPVLQIARNRPMDPALAHKSSGSLPPPATGNVAQFYTPLQSPSMDMGRKRSMDPILQQKLAAMQAPLAGGEMTPFRTPLQSPSLGGGRKRPVRLSKPGTPIASPRFSATSNNKMTSPVLRHPISSSSPVPTSVSTPGGTIQVFDPSIASQSAQTRTSAASVEAAVATVRETLSIKPLDESSDSDNEEEQIVVEAAGNETAGGPLSDDESQNEAYAAELPESDTLGAAESPFQEEIDPTMADAAEDSNCDSDVAGVANIDPGAANIDPGATEKSEDSNSGAESGEEGEYEDDWDAPDERSPTDAREEENDILAVFNDEGDHSDESNYVDDDTGSRGDGDEQYDQGEETSLGSNRDPVDVLADDDQDMANMHRTQNDFFEEEKFPDTPPQEQKHHHFVFLSDQKNVPSELKRLEEKTRRRRRELRKQFHDLECQVGLAASKFAEEKMDLGLAIRDTFDRTCCRPLEAAAERVVMELETLDRRHNVVELEKQMSRLDNQMMRHVHVALSDAKRDDLDSLRQDLLLEIIPSMRIEKSKADKIEGGVVRRYELNAGNVAKMFHEESAARRAALDKLNRRVKRMLAQEEQRSDDVLDVVRNIRERIQRERNERIAADKHIMEDITRTSVAMRRAFLAAFDDSSS
eukprot:scaffold4343_cov144-Cylindrotheca_fusiformis.AAC.29